MTAEADPRRAPLPDADAIGGGEPARRLFTVVFCVLCSWELARAPAGAALSAAAGLAALAVGTWTTFNVGRQRRWPVPVLVALLVTFAAASGVLVDKAPVAIGLLAIVGVLAGTTLPLAVAALPVAVALAALGATALATSMPTGAALGGAAALLLGLLGGVTRADARRRARDRASQLLAEERLELEQARSEVLAERNRVAREIHDVLAHSLGALAVQLEAADALLEGGDPRRARAAVRASRELVRSGLSEARRGVRALRDEPLALVEELEELIAREPAAEGRRPLLEVRGEARPLAPAVAQALYRAGQEALANARKHARGSVVHVALEFAGDAARLVVENGPADDDCPPAALAASGGGFGLAGMRERLELAGGTLRAGPQGAGWRVEACAPACVAAGR